MSFLHTLQGVIQDRKANPQPGSYTAKLLDGGPGTVAQKFGEEAVELVVAALAESDERVISESADVLYSLLVLLAQRGLTLAAVESELEQRHQP